VKELARLLTTNNISGAPVIDMDGKLIGIVTESDLIDQNKKIHIPTVVSILDSFIFLESPDRMEQEIRKIAGSTVADIYTADTITVNEDTPVDELATIMSEKNIHTIPVLKGDKLTGIIGKRDIIKTIIT
jgi:CBS domain-containing protein